MSAMAIISLFSIIFDGMTSAGGVSVMVVVGAWLAGKGLLLLLKAPITRRMLGYGLKTAGAPAVVVGKWLSAGPLTIFTGPIICLFVIALFWLFTFMDRLLTYLKPDVCEMVTYLRIMLTELGSTDRQLYLQAKTMTTPQVTAATKMAEAVAAPQAELSTDQLATLMRAQAISSALQQDRLTADP